MQELKSFDLVAESLGEISVKKDATLKGLTRYGTGGNAKLLIEPKTEFEFIKAVNVVKKLCPYFILGGGNNVLVSDNGFLGAVISTKKLIKAEIKGNLYIAECGVPLSKLVEDAYLNSLGGLEFAVGIPATVGGAVSMNAGCYGKSVGDYVRYVVTENGTVKNADCGFSYRSSRFLGSEAVVKVCFALTPAEPDGIEAQLNLYKSFRRNPKGKNCGSVFKNDGYFAGKVIDECGLKGLKVGGATVSNMHANFIIADNTATSNDIYTLIKTIKEKVYEKQKITLFEELIYLGEF